MPKQRRYEPSAVVLVGEILVLQDIGFTLREAKDWITARATSKAGWQELHRRKLAELDQRIARVQAARTSIAHGLACPHEDLHDCPSFHRIIDARLAGASLEEAHAH